MVYCSKMAGVLRRVVFAARNFHPKPASAVIQVGHLGHVKPYFPQQACNLYTINNDQLSTVKIDSSKSVAFLKLNRKPVNSYNMKLMEEISLVLDDLEKSQDCQGLIITSNIPNVFCAGLDLKEVLSLSNSGLVVFRKTFQDMWIRLYGSRLVTMAAIKGHAVAGGTFLALTCDYTVMATGFKAGVPELALGLYLAPWLASTLINAVGQNRAEKMIYRGEVFSADDAADLGLISKVTHVDAVMTETKNEMDRWLAVPAKGREMTKQTMRRDLLTMMEESREEDIEMFITMVKDPKTRELIARRLQKKNI